MKQAILVVVAILFGSAMFGSIHSYISPTTQHYVDIVGIFVLCYLLYTQYKYMMKIKVRQDFIDNGR